MGAAGELKKEEENEIRRKSTIEERIDEGVIKGAKEIMLLDKTELKKMSKYICKISGNNIGTGFFCRIKYGFDLIEVLITNYHVIDDNYLNNNKELKYCVDGKSKVMNVDKNSKIYSSIRNKYDIMIIKLDKEEIKDYLNIDENIFNINSENSYKNEQIYILHYPNSGEASISYGCGIEKIDEYNIKHLCNTEPGSSGGPILSLLTNKIIGIHKGCIKKKSKNIFNIGTFLKFPLNELNSRNEIQIKIRIKKKDINKNIYFLDNTDYKKEEIKHFHDNIKEFNKLNIELYINNRNEEYKKYFIPEKEGTYTIILKFNISIKDCSYMFYNCYNIINIDLSNFDTKNVLNVNNMFAFCESLKSINGISKLNTSNVADMSSMFCNCISLISLPDILNWDISNVFDMNHMFYACESLKSLPDITIWDTKNVKDMSYMFSLCKSLISLPDISKWNTKNVKDMSYMFYFCRSLGSLPDISKWNTKNVKDMSYMFYFCRSLDNLPDISKWNTTNVKNMDSIFDNCKSMSISPLKEEKKIGKELVTNNKTIKAILSLILYNQSFINKIQSSIKEGEINKGYLIKYDFMNDIFKLDIYKIIFDYICNNQNIQKLLPKLLYNDYNIFYEKILKEFDAETINKINKYNKENNIYSNQYDANIKNLKLNNNIFSYITNNFFILNEELYKLFSSSKDLFYIENNFEYFYKEKKIFIKLDKLRNKNSLLICYINNRNELILEEIFYFFNSKNRENCIEQIKEEGLSKYQGYLLFNEGDLFSPIFDKNQNYIGNAYKYDPLINDYTKYNINFEIRKMILLYLNYKKLRNPNGSNNNKFKEYYLINESWMDNYKDYYKFNEISYEFDKNSSIQTIINSIINTDKNNNFNLKDKLVALIIKLLPKKIIHDFNIRDREFNYKFNNEEIQNPNTILMNYNVNNILFYYSDFELVNAKIYDSLFKYMNMNILIEEGKGVVNNDNFVMKAEKVECIFEAELIIIQFPNKNTEGKYLIEIGKLNNNNIFEPEYFLLYEQYNYLNEHFQNIINSNGFKEYCKTFSYLPLNTMEIIDNNNIKIGIAIKKNMNPEYDKNNNLNILNQQYSTNIQQDKIKNANNICIKEGQENKNNMIINCTQLLPKLNSIFPWAPRVGLDNIGATCYMNAILQCFCQIDEFASYFKCDKLHNQINEAIEKCNIEKKDSLTASFKILVEKIWPDEAMHYESNKRHFPPKEFRQKIADMSPLFKNIGANDAKDLINFIIMTLHEELNQSIVGNNLVQQNNLKCGNQIEYLFQVFYQDYQRTFRSKISELFYAIQQTQTNLFNL